MLTDCDSSTYPSAMSSLAVLMAALRSGLVKMDLNWATMKLAWALLRQSLMMFLGYLGTVFLKRQRVRLLRVFPWGDARAMGRPMAKARMVVTEGRCMVGRWGCLCKWRGIYYWHGQMKV